VKLFFRKRGVVNPKNLEKNLDFLYLKILFTSYIPTLVFIFFVIRLIWNTSLIFEQIVISSIIATLVSLTASKYFNRLTFVNLLIVVLLSTTSAQFLANVLLNIDRSRSFYVLSWVRYGKITLKDGDLDYSSVKSPEKNSYEAITQRVDEQTKRGLIRISDKCELTFRGKMTVHISDFLAKAFSLEGWKSNNQ
jgi:hypothetical protein